MLLSQYFAQNSQRLNATNYPANCEYNLIPPSIQPTEFGGIGEYFAVVRAEINSATYAADNNGMYLQKTYNNNIANSGIDIYRDTPTGIVFVGAISTGTGSNTGVVGEVPENSFSFNGKWLVAFAYDPSDNIRKILLVDCETLTLTWTPTSVVDYVLRGGQACWIDGEPFAGLTRHTGSGWQTDFIRCTDGQFFSGVYISSASCLYGEYSVRQLPGNLEVAKLRTAPPVSGSTYPSVEFDPDMTSNTTVDVGHTYEWQILPPLDGSYTFSNAAAMRLFTIEPATAQVTLGLSVRNSVTSTLWGRPWWGRPYWTGPSHQYPNMILHNGCLGYGGPKSGFMLFDVTLPAPAQNPDGGYVVTDPYWGRQCATTLMQTSNPVTPANLTTIPVKYSGLVSLHRGLITWDANLSKVETFGVTDWKTPTTWSAAMASAHCPWYIDASSPQSYNRQDTLFTLDYKNAQHAWVLKNRHPVGLHCATADSAVTGTKLRLYALVSEDGDVNHGHFGIVKQNTIGTVRNANDKRVGCLTDTDYDTASGVLFLGKPGAPGFTPDGILTCLATDSADWLRSYSGALAPVSGTLTSFLETLSHTVVVETEAEFFADWSNRASKSYVDLTFESRSSTGYVYVTIEVFRNGTLTDTAEYNSYTLWNYYNLDGTVSLDKPALIQIGSACSTQPLIIEPLVTPKPFVLRM